MPDVLGAWGPPRGCCMRNSRIKSSRMAFVFVTCTNRFWFTSRSSVNCAASVGLLLGCSAGLLFLDRLRFLLAWLAGVERPRFRVTGFRFAALAGASVSATALQMARMFFLLSFSSSRSFAKTRVRAMLSSHSSFRYLRMLFS